MQGDVKLRTYLVILHTPLGAAEIEVPTTLGPDAAGRRAVLVGCHQQWGDLDTIWPTHITEI